jgi:hypothetical protein
MLDFNITIGNATMYQSLIYPGGFHILEINARLSCV